MAFFPRCRGRMQCLKHVTTKCRAKYGGKSTTSTQQQCRISARHQNGCFIALTLSRAQPYDLRLCWHEPSDTLNRIPEMGKSLKKFSCWKLWTPCTIYRQSPHGRTDKACSVYIAQRARGDETTHCFHFDSYSSIIMRLLKWQINQHAHKVMATLFLLIRANKWNTHRPMPSSITCDRS